MHSAVLQSLDYPAMDRFPFFENDRFVFKKEEE